MNTFSTITGIIAALGGAVTGITTIVLLLTKFSKWAKKPMAQLIAGLDELRELIKKNNAATCAAVKHSIAFTYHSLSNIREIDRHTLGLVIEMHDQYKALGGNGFIDTIVAEIKTFKIVD